MKTNKWLWLIIAIFGWSFYACSDEEDIGYESSPDWATEGGYKVLESTKGELTQEEAWELVKKEVLNYDTSKINVFVSNCIIEPRQKYKIGYENIITPNYRCWMFFIDDHPTANWSHACRYAYVKLNGSNIKVETAGWMISGLWDNFTAISVMDSDVNINSRAIFGSYNGSMNISKINHTANHHAIIISGGINRDNNHYRYWNNCSAIYNVLTQKYGFPKENIKSLISDGNNEGADRIFYHPNFPVATRYESSPTDLDQDGVDDVTAAATLANVRSVFSNLRNTLTPEDELFIFITSHGGYDGAYYATLWNEEKLYADELKSILSNFQTDNIQIVNTTCTSGGFIPSLTSTNRVIATACRADENSYSYSPFEFDAFAYYWISGMLGQEIDDLSTSVNCDLNSDNKISFHEAFEYAKTNAETSYEHAQYLSTPEKLGNSVGLENIWFKGKIAGNLHFCNQAIYSIENLPATANVVWNVSVSEYSIIDNEWTYTISTHQSSTLTLSNYSLNRPQSYSIEAIVTENDKEREFGLAVTSNEYAPYMGTLAWSCGVKTGQSNHSFYQDFIEFELEQTQEFYATSYTDILNRFHENPYIYDVTSPDFSASAMNNMAEICPICPGEGEMEVYLSNGCNEGGIPFIVPYIVFDPNSYSLLLNKNNSTLNIASQTTTYGLRNENPIRTIEVRTYDRQTLLSFNLEDEQTNVADIDISSLSPGTYVLKVTDDSVHYLKLVI